MEAPVSLWCGVLFGWFLVNTDWIFELFCDVSRSQMNLWLVKMVAPACQIFILFLFFSPQLGQEGIKNYFSSGSRLDHGPANKHEQLSRGSRVGDTWPAPWQPRGRHVAVLLYFPFDLLRLSYSPLLCWDVTLSCTFSCLLKTARILHVEGLLSEWRGGRDSWFLIILVSRPFLSSGWPALALKNVLPVTEWKSVSVLANGQHLEE